MAEKKVVFLFCFTKEVIAKPTEQTKGQEVVSTGISGIMGTAKYKSLFKN